MPPDWNVGPQKNVAQIMTHKSRGTDTLEHLTSTWNLCLNHRWAFSTRLCCLGGCFVTELRMIQSLGTAFTISTKYVFQGVFSDHSVMLIEGKRSNLMSSGRGWEVLIGETHALTSYYEVWPLWREKQGGCGAPVLSQRCPLGLINPILPLGLWECTSDLGEVLQSACTVPLI